MLTTAIVDENIDCENQETCNVGHVSEKKGKFWYYFSKTKSANLHV